MSREEAIEVIRKEYACVDADCDIERNCGRCELHMPSKEPILKAYDMAIQALTQEPCTDAVSREDALDCLNGAWGDYSVLNEVYERISKLPSVNPQPCDDAISREDAIKVTCNDCQYDKCRYRESKEHCDCCGYIDRLRVLPSVKPSRRKGHWEDLHRCWVCSECNQETHVEWNFCPNCGAKMESEVSNEKDKYI